MLDRPTHGEGASGRHRALSLVLVTLAALIARLACAAEQAKPDATPTAAQSAKFSPAQIEQLVAPIALYPDGLAVQVLIAATYPLEVVEAARWRTKNASLKGEALDQALESRDWDPSVESLMRFPDLLQRMSDNLDWTKDLGDAFLGQKDDVLDAVQRMRAKAYESGALKTTKEQVVTREIVKEKEIIRVEPADPQVVYVPTYSPDAVYGPPPTPYYPAMTGYPPGYVATASLLSFGAGMAVGAAVWGGDCDWDSHDVYHHGGGGGGNNQNVNINRNKEKNVDRSRNRTRGEGGRQRWQHNPEHRGGVRYRDEASAKKYGGRDQVASRDRANRDVARGVDRGQAGGARASQLPAGGRSQQAAARPGAGPGQGGGRPGSGGQVGGPGGQRPGGSVSQQPATRPGGAAARPDTRDRGGAFGGYESGRSAREASARGAASRGGPSYAGGGRGQRGGGGFGGGGGGGGRGGFGGGGRAGGGGGGGGGRGGGGRGGGGRGGGGRGGRR
jgi:hypothetical protein